MLIPLIVTSSKPTAKTVSSWFEASIQFMSLFFYHLAGRGIPRQITAQKMDNEKTPPPKKNTLIYENYLIHHFLIN